MGGDVETRKLVTFEVAGRSLAAPIESVRETVELRPITPLFATPPALLGLVSLRGEILAVLDVGLLLGLGATRRDERARLIVLDVDDVQAALLVEALGPLRAIPRAAVAPVPDTLPAAEAALLLGIVSLPERPLAVLDPARLLDAPALRPHRRRREASDSKESSSR